MLNSQAIITYQCWYWGYPEGGEGAKVPQNPIRFCHEYCGLCETLYICSASMLDGWLNTFYSYKSEMKYSNDQFELLGVGDCTFTRYFKTTLTLVAVATSVLALRGENHDFSWPLMTQWVDNIGNCKICQTTDTLIALWSNCDDDKDADNNDHNFSSSAMDEGRLEDGSRRLKSGWYWLWKTTVINIYFDTW